MSKEEINEFDDAFWTPLMHAVEDGDMERFENLVAAGADVNLGNREAEEWPIVIAAENGREEMFFRLVELGAKLEVDEYCCPTCDMWYGFKKADLFCAATESGSTRIARYLCFMGVRPWSKTRSMVYGGQTVREFAKLHNKEASLATVFSNSELASNKEERNIFEWLGWDSIRLCRDVHNTHDSGYWPVAVCMPDDSDVSHFGRRDKPETEWTLRVYEAKAYYAVRVWEEARRRCVEKGIDADGEAVWFNAAPTHRLIRYGHEKWDSWYKFASAMFDEMERIADSGMIKIHLGQNPMPCGMNASKQPLKDYVVPKIDGKGVHNWSESDLDALPTDGQAISFAWKEISACFLRLTAAQVSFLHAEQMARFADCDEALFEACSRLDVPAMEKAIANGANVFATNRYDDTVAEEVAEAIMSAEIDEDTEARGKELEKGRMAFRFLLEHGGDLDFAGYGAVCPIYGTGHGYPELTRILLELGAAPNTCSFFMPDEYYPVSALEHLKTDRCIHGDEEGMFSRVERMLYRAGGMTYGIWALDDKQDNDMLDSEDRPGTPKEDFPKSMAMRDRKLIQAVRRGWEYNTQLAVRWGGDPAARDAQGRNLVRIFLEDYETYSPKEGASSQEFFTDFVLFLLNGIRVPVTDDEMSAIIAICKDKGYEDCLKELLALWSEKKGVGNE